MRDDLRNCFQQFACRNLLCRVRNLSCALARRKRQPNDRGNCHSRQNPTDRRRDILLSDRFKCGIGNRNRFRFADSFDRAAPGEQSAESYDKCRNFQISRQSALKCSDGDSDGDCRKNCHRQTVTPTCQKRSPRLRPLRPSSEPTDRSILPETITINIPTAKIPVTKFAAINWINFAIA